MDFMHNFFLILFYITSAASSPLPEGNKPELDLLSSVSVKETNHNPHLNHAINNQGASV